MFQIDRKDIPLLRTGAALLILDMQNDIVSADGVLQVDLPPRWIDNINHLIPVFRSWGLIMWTCTQFEKHRAVNDGSVDAESVITDKELPADVRQRKLSSLGKTCAAEGKAETKNHETNEEGKQDRDEEVNETFLTLGPGEDPKCCIPTSLGVNFHPSMLQGGGGDGFDSKTDLIFLKSHYSAFKSGALLQRLRSSMVTELFICGALTNIGIYATVLDAARHGFSITIISDCCGYKSEARHNEALRQMTASLGCDTMTSSQIIEDIEARKREEARRDKNRARPREPAKLERNNGKSKVIEKSSDAGLNEMMGSLALKEGDSKAIPSLPQPETSRSHLSSVSRELPLPRSDMGWGSLPDAVSPSTNRKDPSTNKTRVKSKVTTRRRPSTSRPKAQKDESSSSSTATAQVQKSRASTGTSADTSGPADESYTGLEAQNTLEMTGAEQSENLTTKGTTHSEAKKTSKTSEKSAAMPVHSEAFCEGDSEMITNLVPDPFADYFFRNLCGEVIWQRMSHQGGDVPRLVAVQGTVSSDGTHPIYRHPSDESAPLYPFSKTVLQIIPHVEHVLGHSVNHVLIQMYRDGTDHITEHSDKTLDIVPGTFIANVSLGAQRTMTFRTKKSNTSGADNPARTVHKEILPHNSMCKFGLKSNAVWLHGVRPDRRLESEKSPEVLAFNGSRISLTFRSIGTFLNRDQTLIWGQGAVAKDKEHAREVCWNSETAEAMVRAFGKENKMGKEFVWEEEYGVGFDVLHLKNERRLVRCDNETSNLRVQILLRELDLEAGSYEEKDLMRPIRLDTNGKEVLADEEGISQVTFVDNDPKRSRVDGDIAILLYLDRVYGKMNTADFDLGKCYTRLLQVDKPLETLVEELPLWESCIAEHGSEGYIAGAGISLVDFAFWPALHQIFAKGLCQAEAPVLRKYYEQFGKRDCASWIRGVSL